jgi:hypothetical protein
MKKPTKPASAKKGPTDNALNEKDPAKRLKIFLERRINENKLSNQQNDVIIYFFVKST